MPDGMSLIRAERGLQARLARELGITSAAVAKWQRVPEDRLLDVERISGIPRNKLRPDLYRGWQPRCTAAKRVPA